jgi:phenylpropionate dioxygenase-like ring-hydroxylating dioxygenase large terminal subunit
MTDVATPAGTSDLGWSREHLREAGLDEPREIYTSTSFAERERRALFLQSWTLVADADALTPGRYLTVEVAGAPVVLWRDSEGTCRAWHNVCSHRGILLLEGEGDLGRYVTCPYHQWSFDLDGDLVRIPQPDQFPDVCRSDLGLRTVAVAEWHGMVFVSLAEQPTDFQAEIGFLDERMATLLALPLVEVARVDYTVRCNWKLLVENHVDVYHLWYLHQRTLEPFKHAAFEWEWHDSLWWSSEPRKDPSSYQPSLPGLTEQEGMCIGAHLLLPNLMIVTTGDYLGTYDARPDGPNRTNITLRIRSLPGADGDALVAAVRSFLSEDIAACEALQRATASPAFRVGPTARTHEEPVRIFHRMLRERVLS